MSQSCCYITFSPFSGRWSGRAGSSRQAVRGSSCHSSVATLHFLLSVGGGAAGPVLVARLSGDPRVTVLLLHYIFSFQWEVERPGRF